MIIPRQRAFSEVEQKEFNSKAQKLLRSKHDIQSGLKKMKELKQGFKPELIGKETTENARRWDREINKTPSSTSAVNPGSIHEKISRKGRIRDFQKKGIFDGYTADNMVKDTISPGLSGRVLARSLK